MKIIPCSNSEVFADEVCKILNTKPVNIKNKRFADGEIWIELLESVRGKDVFIVQSLSNPVNDGLMELCIATDAVKRSSAASITAVIPYFGYARQDRKSSPRTPITAKLVANILQVSGIDRLISVDLHAGQIQGFFDIPADDLATDHVFAVTAENMLKKLDLTIKDVVIVSPDVGGIRRARRIAKRLNTNIAIIDKRRPEAGVSEVLNIIGDVENKFCIIVDDIVDSAGTLCNAAAALKKSGAKSISACITHPVLSGPAVQRIQDSCLDNIFVSDTIKLKQETLDCKKIVVVSIANMIADVILRISKYESVSEFFTQFTD